MGFVANNSKKKSFVMIRHIPIEQLHFKKKNECFEKLTHLKKYYAICRSAAYIKLHSLEMCNEERAAGSVA